MNLEWWHSDRAGDCAGGGGTRRAGLLHHLVWPGALVVGLAVLVLPISETAQGGPAGGGVAGNGGAVVQGLLRGANTCRAGYNNGVITDFNGQFTLECSTRKDTRILLRGLHYPEITVKGSS